MNAIDFTTNFHEATSIYSSKDLYAKKRAKLGEAKRVAIDALYDEFLANIAVPQESVEPVNNDKIYQEILASRNMTVYTSDINSAAPTLFLINSILFFINNSPNFFIITFL